MRRVKLFHLLLYITILYNGYTISSAQEDEYMLQRKDNKYHKQCDVAAPIHSEYCTSFYNGADGEDGEYSAPNYINIIQPNSFETKLQRNLVFTVVNNVDSRSKLQDGINSGVIINLVDDIMINATVNITQVNPLVINGNGYSLNGLQQVLVMRIDDSQVSLNNLVVTNGRSKVGGGIYVKLSVLVANGCLFSYNEAVGTGGGVFAVGSFLQFVGSKWSNNNASVAGGLMSLYSITQLTNSIFENNMASQASAAVIHEGGTTTITGCEVMNNFATITTCINFFRITSGSIQNTRFSNNAVTGYGATISLQQSIVTIRNVVIEHGTMTGPYAEGGGLVAFFSTVSIANSTFLNNSADVYAGGLFGYYSVFSVEDTRFVENRAGIAGGGLVVGFTTAVLKRCFFVNNRVWNGNGGAIFVLSDSVIELQDSLLQGNVASQSGGGFFVTGFDSAVSLISSSLLKNVAGINGGGVAVASGSVEITNCEFNENGAISPVFSLLNNSNGKCRVSGGCMYSGNHPALYENNEYCKFQVLGDGVLESIYFTSEPRNDVLTLEGVDYSGLTGPDEVSMTAYDTIEWQCDGSNVLAGFELCLANGARGGGLYIEGSSTMLTVVNTSISFGAATQYGGGLYQDGGEVFFTHVHLKNNTAQLGGFDLLLSGGTFEAVNLTIDQMENLEDSIDGNSAQSATCISACAAGYGGQCRTSDTAANCNFNCQCDKCEAGRYLESEGSTSSESDCMSCSAGYISSEGSSTCESCVSGRFATNNASDFQGGLIHPVVEGATVCNPCPAGYFAPLEASFICQACSSGKTSDGVGNATCHDCEGGRFSSGGAATCTACEVGKYSDAGSSKCVFCPTGYDSETGSSSCTHAAEGYYLSPKDTSKVKSCVSNAVCLGADFGPIPASGYWVDRSSYDYADKMFQCSRVSCISKSTNSSCWRMSSYGYEVVNNKSSSTLFLGCDSHELQCREGSHGPLCGACEDDYIYKGELNRCEKCGRMSIVGIIIICSSVLIAAAILGYRFLPLKYRPVSSMAYVSTILESVETGSLKVVWVTCQIIVSTRWNLDIKFPPPFTYMFEFLSLFSFDFLSLECLSEGEYRFYFAVYSWSFIPMFAAVFIILVYVFRRYVLIHSRYFERKKSKIFNQNIWLLLLLTYVVLPAASMKQLQSFNCIDINESSYLRVDTSVDCNSSSYLAFRSVIVTVFCLYQLIPIIWMVLLFRQRKLLCPPSSSLLQEDIVEEFIEARDSNETLAPLRFLFKDYKLNKWWFEVVEMYRRILFIGFLPLVSSVPATRACFGCILSILSLAYFGEEEPYQFESTNSFAYVAQFVLLMVYYAALSIETGVMLVFGLTDFGIGVLLLVLNVSIVSYVFYLTWRRFLLRQALLKWRRTLTEGELGILNEVMNDPPTIPHISFQEHNSMLRISSDGGPAGGGVSVADGASRPDSAAASTSSSFSEPQPGGQRNLNDKTSSFYQEEKTKASAVLKQHLIEAKHVVFKKRIGAGSCGEVFKGTCMGEPVAIKTMLDVTEENVKEFRAEIVLTASLRHPNIVNFIGACWGKQLICLVLEWVEKGSLSDFLKSSRSLHIHWEDPLLRLAMDVARGMKYLHTRSFFDEQEQEIKSCILHRDLKPDNVLVSEFIAGKISDFGTSRFKSVENVVMTGVGTPLYVAPELVRGEEYDEKVDVYSFGLTLMEMSIEQPILEFIGSRWMTDFDKKKIPKSPIRFIRPMNEDGWRPVTVEKPIEFAPPSINDLIIKCCHHNPPERPCFTSILDQLSQVKQEIERKNYRRRLSSLTRSSKLRFSTANTLNNKPLLVIQKEQRDHRRHSDVVVLHDGLELNHVSPDIHRCSSQPDRLDDLFVGDGGGGGGGASSQAEQGNLPLSSGHEKTNTKKIYPL